MHSRGDLGSMQVGIRFDDVVDEVRRELGQALERAERAGIDPSQVVLDPGIGFGKTWEQNLELIARLDELAALGRPLLLGASRKSFLAKAAAAGSDQGPERREPAPAERLGGSLAAAAWGKRKGVAVLRVHDVAETVQFLAVDGALAAREVAG
jgi:dihydropteroate synthase